MAIFFTRSRPYKKNDRTAIESKNNHLVRKYRFCSATTPPRNVLCSTDSGSWSTTSSRLPDPTIKPVGYGSSRDGRRRRLYDEPMTPLAQLAAGIASPAQESDLLTYRDSLNPAAIAGRKSPIYKPPCSDSPRTRPNSSTSPPYPPPYPRSNPASASKQDRQLTPISRAFLT